MNQYTLALNNICVRAAAIVSRVFQIYNRIDEHENQRVDCCRSFQGHFLKLRWPRNYKFSEWITAAINQYVTNFCLRIL